MMSGRDQYGAEGFILGFMQLACGLMVIGANRAALASPGADSLVGVSSNAKPKESWFFSLPTWVYLIGMVFGWTQIVRIYTMKNGGYNMGFVWDKGGDWF